METLADLTELANFEGTRVPAAPLNGPCLSLFGQILTHPSRVTFPWAPLRHALYTYFGSPPANLDPNKIGAGWCGLSLILTAFKRLEVVESQEETQEVLTWLTALKIAAVRRSLAFEVTTVSTLQDVLTNLHEPVPAEELRESRGRANSNASSLPYQKPVAPTMSFERGSDATRSPTSESHLSNQDGEHSASPAPLGSEQNGGGGGRPRSESFGQAVGLAGRHPRAETVSTSMLGSFADFSDQHDIDPLDLSSSESEDDEEDDEDEYLAPGQTKKKGRNGRGGRRSKSNGGTPGATGLTPGGSDRAKVNSLAARLAEVTGIPLAKCIDTLSRFPDEDLSAINPNAPIPAQFLPPGMLAPQPAPFNPYANAQIPPPRKSSSATPKPKTQQKQEFGPDGLPIKKATRTQRPHDPNRPNFSYSALIGQAILSAPGKRLRLAEIYEFVTNNYAYYKKNECGWQNSIRHNLSLQPVFKKIPDLQAPGKKGCFWTIIEAEEWRFANGGWQKMEKGQGGSHHKKKSAKEGGGSGAAGSRSGNKQLPPAKRGMKDEFDDDGGSMDGGNGGELYSEEED